MAYTFEGEARKTMTAVGAGENVDVWTDGLLLQSSWEPGWPCAFRLHRGKRYRVTVEEIEHSSKGGENGE